MMEIDARVQSLVAALNELPGVLTFSSCGGHVEPASSQVPADEFYVNFDVDRTVAAWRSLEIVALAVQATDAFLNPWFNGEDASAEGLCFELTGDRGLDPDLLAREILDLYDPRP